MVITFVAHTCMLSMNCTYHIANINFDDLTVAALMHALALPIIISSRGGDDNGQY